MTVGCARVNSGATGVGAILRVCRAGLFNVTAEGTPDWESDASGDALNGSLTPPQGPGRS